MRARATPCLKKSATLRATTQQRRQELAEARTRLAHRSPETRVQQESRRLLALWKRLQSASPASVLNRGYVILRDPDNRPIGRRTELRKGQAVTAEFGDGKAPLRAE